MFFDRRAVFVTFKGGHSHRSGSFYAGHHFDRPNQPKGYGNHNNHNNGNWNHGGSHKGNGNHNPSMNHGNRPMTGNGNGNPSMGGGFGNSHRSGSANTPSRTSGTRPSGNVASHGNGGTSAATEPSVDAGKRLYCIHSMGGRDAQTISTASIFGVVGIFIHPFHRISFRDAIWQECCDIIT